MRPDNVVNYKIKTIRCSFIITMTTKFNDDNTPISFGFKLGACFGNKGCVNCTVLPPPTNLRLRAWNDNSSANISWIGFDKNCSTDGALQKGTGTKHMIVTAMSFIQIKCDWVKTFNVNDASTITCFDAVEMSLPHISIMLSEKTWYEKQFGAKITESSKHQFYRNRLSLLRSVEEKLAFPFKAFIDAFKVPRKTFIYFKPLYDTSATFSELFQNLKKTFPDQTAFCRAVYPWGKNLISYIVTDRIDFNMLKWVFENSKPVTALTITDVADESMPADVRRMFGGIGHRESKVAKDNISNLM